MVYLENSTPSRQKKKSKTLIITMTQSLCPKARGFLFESHAVGQQSLSLKILKIFFGLSLWLVSMPGFAQSTVDGHDVVRRIADASFEDVQSSKAFDLSMRLPKHWRSKFKDQTVYFADANAPSVMGAIFLAPEGIESIEQAYDHIASLFPTTLEGQKATPTSTDGGLTGTKAQATARLGGEVCAFLIFLGKDANGRQVLFFAQAPKYWFNSYHALFEDVLNALTLP